MSACSRQLLVSPVELLRLARFSQRLLTVLVVCAAPTPAVNNNLEDDWSRKVEMRT